MKKTFTDDKNKILPKKLCPDAGKCCNNDFVKGSYSPFADRILARCSNKYPSKCLSTDSVKVFEPINDTIDE